MPEEDPADCSEEDPADCSEDDPADCSLPGIHSGGTGCAVILMR